MAFNKPAQLPQWASDALGNATAGQVVSPGTTKQTVGFNPGEKPPAGFINWLFWCIFTWILFFNDLQEQGFTGAGSMGAWTQPHQFNNTITVLAGTGTNTTALVAQGNGSGSGVFGQGASGPGVQGVSTSGSGGSFTGGGAGAGVTAEGGASGTGIHATGHGVSPGGSFIGGESGGYGVLVNTTGGIGVYIGQPSALAGTTHVSGLVVAGSYGSDAGAIIFGDAGLSAGALGSPGVVAYGYGTGPAFLGTSNGNGAAVMGVASGSGANAAGGSFQGGGSAPGVVAVGGAGREGGNFTGGSGDTAGSVHQGSGRAAGLVATGGGSNGNGANLNAAGLGTGVNATGGSGGGDGGTFTGGGLGTTANGLTATGSTGAGAAGVNAVAGAGTNTTALKATATGYLKKAISILAGLLDFSSASQPAVGDIVPSNQFSALHFAKAWGVFHTDGAGGVTMLEGVGFNMSDPSVAVTTEVTLVLQNALQNSYGHVDVNPRIDASGTVAYVPSGQNVSTSGGKTLVTFFAGNVWGGAGSVLNYGTTACTFSVVVWGRG